MKKILTGAALYALPFVALAQTNNLGGVATTVGQILNLIIPIVGGLLLIYFFVGVIGYVNAGGEEEKRTAARNTMIYAVIGMFVAFSIFGLVKLLQNTFTGGAQGTSLNLPNVPGLSNF